MCVCACVCACVCVCVHFDSVVYMMASSVLLLQAVVESDYFVHMFYVALFLQYGWTVTYVFTVKLC